MDQLAPTRPLNVAIVLASTRPGRKTDAVANWVLNRAQQRLDAEFAIVDIADYTLPELDEPIPAIVGAYEHAHTKRWAEAVTAYDAFIFVTPEYNHSVPGALKNAIDYLYAEWNNKVAGFVSYGADARGSRAVEHLRLILAELQVATVRGHVSLSLYDDFEEFTTFAPRSRHDQKLDEMLDQMVAWAAALRSVRQPLAAS